MTVSDRIRTHEGSGLTIRIPRQLSERSATHPTHHPLVSPGTHPRSSNPVTKSKSFTTSMDKLTTSQQQQHQSSGGSSRESSQPCSRGSTPSSSRSSVPSRPPSRRSYPNRSSRSPDRLTPELEERCGKTNSPSGSEVSLHSVKSANSVKSSASAKSNLSAKSNASIRSNVSVRSSASAKSNGSVKSDTASKSPKNSPNISTGSSKQSLKSATPKSAKARSPAPTHGSNSNNSTSTPSQRTPLRRRSTSSIVSSASSGDAAQQNGMACQEQQNSTSSSRRTTPPRQTPSRNSGSGTPNSTGTPRHVTNKKPLPVFNSYMSLFQVQEKLKRGEVIEGVLRINPKNYEDAYISAPDGGMDIFIGGVRDRNAALHGDVVMVEINSPDQWKVLYEQLDDYLEKNPQDMSIVYSPLEPSLSASVSSIASPCNRTSNNTTTYKHVTQLKKSKVECTNIETLDNLGHLDQCDSDVVIEDNETETNDSTDIGTATKKRRRKGRGKKKRQPKEGTSQSVSAASLDLNATESIAVLSSQGSLAVMPLQLELPKDNGSGFVGCDSDEDMKQYAVPPDQLSECDFTDDESGCSEVLDYEQAKEDEAFFQAQWNAYQEQQQQQPPPKEEEGDAALAELAFVKEEPTLADGLRKLNIKDEGDTDKTIQKLQRKISSVTVSSDSSFKKEMGKEALCAKSVNSVNKDDQERGVGCASTVDTVSHNSESFQSTKKKQRHKKRIGFQKGKSKDEPVDTKLKQVDSVSSVSTGSVIIGQDSPATGQVCRSLNETAFTPSKSFTPLRKQNYSPEKARYRDPNNGQGNLSLLNRTSFDGNKKNSNIKKIERTSPSLKQVQRLPSCEKFIQKTGHVVYIVTKKHSRIAAGTLKLFADKNPHMALFSPNDSRIPRLKIPMKQCPPDFFTRHQDYLSRIFLARVVEWNEPKFAFGELVRDLGLVGDIEAETEALLLEHNIDYSEFPEAVLYDLPEIPWLIPSEEIANRTDLRDECIFTIDPATARDLDDAVSCHPLPSGNFRVGVHIADVSYFVKEESPLDQMASDRATSVYLTQKVIPMLPRVLCEHLCSLNPGEDRLAFSVIWELSPQGKVIGEWFGKTIIRSCVKLSYDHAQSMIENPEKDWAKDEFPNITGNYSLKDISSVVNNLQSIAKHLRKKRFDDGALRLDQVKIAFNLDHETGMPNGFYEYVIRDSNRLIEEFMLLANMAVAHKIYQGNPALAILRRHPAPLGKPMENLVNLLNGMDVHLDISSAGSLQRSLQHYIGDDKYSASRLQVIISLCSKPMQNAVYFCAGALRKDESLSHYALNVPLYTHFTSPIRRYADVLVHRMLAAIVAPDRFQLTMRGEFQLQKITERCNDRKQTSKIVQELSSELYLSLFIRQIDEMNEDAMVTMILDRAFDVLVLKIGVIKRVYIEKLPLEGFELRKQEGRKFLYLYWKAEGDLPCQTQKIGLFTLVSVTLKAVEGNALKFNAFLRRPL